MVPYPEGSDEAARYALWMLPDGKLGQSSVRPAIKAGVDYFFNDENGFIGVGTVRRFGVLEPSTETFETEEYYKAGAAQGKLAAWLSYSSKTVQLLRVWKPDGLGVRTLLEVPVEPEEASLGFFLAVSPTHIVGRFAKPKPGDPSTKVGSKLWYTAHTTDPEEAKLTFKVSPPLPMPPDVPELLMGAHRTWGDYVLQQYSPILGDIQARVIHLTTWKIYVFHPDAGFTYSGNRAIGISDKHVYIAQRDKNIGSYDVSLLKRYELSKLANTAAHVQTP